MTNSHRLFATAVAMLAAGAPAASALALRVDSLFSRHVRPDGPGCAVGIYRSGEVVLIRGYYGVVSVEDGRPITPRTTFNLGSAAKPFTALAALMLEPMGMCGSFVEDLAHWDRNFDEPAVGGAALIARVLGRPQLASGDTIPYAYGLRLGSYKLTHLSLSTPLGEEAVQNLRFVRVAP